MSSVPRNIESLPILLVRRPNQECEAKEFVVNRHPVLHVLKFVVEKNEVWKQHKIVINFENIEMLPIISIIYIKNKLIDKTACDNFCLQKKAVQ